MPGRAIHTRDIVTNAIPSLAAEVDFPNRLPSSVSTGTPSWISLKKKAFYII